MTTGSRRTWEGLDLAGIAPEETAREMGSLAAEHREELRECVRAGRFPRGLYREMGRRGWMSAIAPVEFGGRGAGAAEYCFLQEEIAAHGLISPQISVQGQRWLIEWGTAEQKARYLPGLADGTLLCSESISEPRTGSSFRNMEARARRDGDEWVLNGHKTHVNLGAEGDVTIFYAMADEGLTSFLVDASSPGISARRTDPIGLRLLPTADVVFDDVRVTDAALLGPAGRGMDTFLSVFNLSRLGNASELIGLSRRALTLALDYAGQRRVGDDLVADFQGIRWTFADSYLKVYAAALARNAAAAAADRGDPGLGLATSVAKSLAVEAAEDVGRGMFAMVGGYGLYYDRDFAEILNDIKVLRIAGGSLEVLRNYIAKGILASDDYLGLR